MNRIKLGTAIALLLLGACSSGGGGGDSPKPGAPNLRPAAAPDMVVLTVSGHSPFGVNFSALDNPTSITVAIAETLDSLGIDYEFGHYADLFAGIDGDGNGEIDDPTREGFVELMADLTWIHKNWIDGFDNPTRVMLLSHSHGANWSHIVAALVPEIPIEYQITLDGVCFAFDNEHRDDLTPWALANNVTLAWDIANSCDAVAVPGKLLPFNAKDVVFANVRVHLEVQSNSSFPVPFDCCPNYRADGTQDGIALLQASEGHSAVNDYGSESAGWVVDQILAAELGEP